MWKTGFIFLAMASGGPDHKTIPVAETALSFFLSSLLHYPSLVPHIAAANSRGGPRSLSIPRASLNSARPARPAPFLFFFPPIFFFFFIWQNHSNETQRLCGSLGAPGLVARSLLAGGLPCVSDANRGIRKSWEKHELAWHGGSWGERIGAKWREGRGPMWEQNANAVETGRDGWMDGWIERGRKMWVRWHWLFFLLLPFWPLSRRRRRICIDGSSFHEIPCISAARAHHAPAINQITALCLQRSVCQTPFICLPPPPLCGNISFTLTCLLVFSFVFVLGPLVL